MAGIISDWLNAVTSRSMTANRKIKRVDRAKGQRPL
jgi:hypothetical protein